MAAHATAGGRARVDAFAGAFGVFDRMGVPLVLAAWLALTASHKALRVEHYAIVVTFTALAWLAPASRRFAWAALPFAVGGLVYENFALLLPLRGSVHVADLYRAEQALFGIGGLIPAHYIQRHTHPALDLVTGAAYALYLPWIFAVAGMLHLREPGRMPELAWGFLVANLIGVWVWLAYPAAPPWYVTHHGFADPALLEVAPSAAGAARFDALLGIRYFEGFYARSTNVFGAMPSLHVTYPTLAVFACRNLAPIYRVVTGLFVALVAFAAVYLEHHYLLDVLGGLAVAWLTQQIVTRARRAVGASAGRAAGAPCP